MTIGLPVKRDLTLAYASSLVVSLGIAVASVAGLVGGSDGLYEVESPLVLVSQGGDAANLIVVLPALLGSLWFVWRGSLIGLLLWPGALFYALYAYAVYLAGAPYSLLLFGYVALVTLSSFTLIGILASIDGEEVRRRFASAPTRRVGGALVVIGVAAYAGLAATAVNVLGSATSEAGIRPQWAVDCALGTPVLLIGGALLWRRAPLGYVAAAGLLLVSGLGGLAFAAAAVLDALLTGRRDRAGGRCRAPGHQRGQLRASRLLRQPGDRTAASCATRDEDGAADAAVGTTKGVSRMPGGVGALATRPSTGATLGIGSSTTALARSCDVQESAAPSAQRTEGGAPDRGAGISDGRPGKAHHPGHRGGWSKTATTHEGDRYRSTTR